MRRSRTLRLTALAGVAALALTGCLQSDDSGSSESSSSESGDTPGAGGSEPGDGEVEVFGAFTGAEQEAFEESLVAFEDESGIDVSYTGNADFTTFVQQRLSGGDPPDIALYPQPGILLDAASDDFVVPIDEFLDTNQLNETLIPGFLDAVTNEEGTVYGAPMRMAVKSVVWVPRQAWEEGGYEEPATFQELLELTDEIKADGITPWCIGYESGAATGWVGTDWVEEMMLRIAGPEVYDQWYLHEIPFDDESVQQSFDAYGEILFGEDNVLGGPEGALSTPFGEAGNPSFEQPPGCMMQRQGNFITGFYPEDVQNDLDGSTRVFGFPPYEGGFEGNPVLGGGDMAALFNGEDDEAKQVMEFLTSDQFGGEWAAAGGWLSPHSTFDQSNYPDQTTTDIANIAIDADVFRYDASDLMPAEVGADSFWKGMVAWTGGEQDTAEVTAAIEESWPSS